MLLNYPRVLGASEPRNSPLVSLPVENRLRYARPYTGSAAPLTSRESSDSKNAITEDAESSETHFVGSAEGIDERFAGVSIVLGRIELMRTPCSSTSCATVCAIVTTAAFDAAYAAEPVLVHGRSTAREPMTTMLPCFASTIDGKSARSARYAVSTLSAIIFA